MERVTGKMDELQPAGACLRVACARELAAFVGTELAPGGWRSVTQGEIDAFIAATGDRNWIHCDTARAAGELAGGRTIVPGQLLLALIPGLLQEIYEVTEAGQAYAVALNRVRFRHMVHPGDMFRLCAVLDRVSERRSFVQVDASCRLELMSRQRVLTMERSDVFLTRG